MEEKKLTDEGIINALECLTSPTACVTLDMCEKCACTVECEPYYAMKGALDLINRQKEEIERLTEKTKSQLVLNQTIQTLNEKILAENAELKKQVDELTERYLEESKERCEFEQKYKKIQHAHNIGLGAQRSHWEKKVEQAVKDTVKEILAMFGDRNYITENELKEAIAKRYGLEVE